MSWIIFLLGLFVGLYIQQFIDALQSKVATLIMGSKQGIALLKKTLEKDFKQKVEVKE